MTHGMLMEVNNCHHNLTLENFHYHPAEILYPLAVPSHISNPCSNHYWDTVSIVSADSLILYILYT